MLVIVTMDSLVLNANVVLVMHLKMINVYLYVAPKKQRIQRFVMVRVFAPCQKHVHVPETEQALAVPIALPVLDYKLVNVLKIPQQL